MSVNERHPFVAWMKCAVFEGTQRIAYSSSPSITSGSRGFVLIFYEGRRYTMIITKNLLNRSLSTLMLFGGKIPHNTAIPPPEGSFTFFHALLISTARLRQWLTCWWWARWNTSCQNTLCWRFCIWLTVCSKSGGTTRVGELWARKSVRYLHTDFPSHTRRVPETPPQELSCWPDPGAKMTSSSSQTLSYFPNVYANVKPWPYK